MGSSAIKNPRRIFSQNGGAIDPSIETRLETLENNEYQIIYWAPISSDSGTITKPTNSTIILDQFQSGADAFVTTIANGQPTGEPVYTSGGAEVDVATFDALGAYTLTDTPSAFDVALIYVIKIKAKDYVNVDSLYEVERYDVGNAKLTDLLSINPVISGQWRGALATASFSTSTFATNLAWFTPYVTGAPHFVVGIRCHISTGIAASSIRLALFSNTGYVVDAVLDESGAIATVAPGIFAYTFTQPILLTSPIYYMSVKFSIGTLQARYFNTGTLLLPRPSNTPFSSFYIGDTYGAFTSPANMAGATYQTGGNTIMLEMLVQ